MGRILGRILWLLAIAAIAYFAYTLYVQWWGTSAFDGAKVTVRNFIDSTLKTSAERAAQTAGQAAQQYVVSVVGEAAGQATQYAKDKAGQAISAVGSALSGSGSSAPAAGSYPVATSSNYATPAPPVTIIARAGIPLTFSVTQGVRYTISWGDGTSDSGTVATDAVKVIAHTWQTMGDYSVKMTLKASSGTQTSIFPVRVY